MSKLNTRARQHIKPSNFALPNGTDKINGVNSSITITTNYGNYMLVTDASANWYIVSSR